MNNIEELVEIIRDLGGKATFEEICFLYQNKYKDSLTQSQRTTIAKTLQDNNKYVAYNSDYSKWEIVSDNKIHNKTGHKYLHVSDDIFFDSNKDVMKIIFNQLVNPYQAFYKIDGTEDYAWFPKFNNDKNGYKNKLESNGTIWTEKIDSAKSKEDNSLQHYKRYAFSTEKNKQGIYKKRFTGVFKHVKTELDGTRIYKMIDDKVEIKNPINSINRNILFCNIAYMKEYKGITDADKPNNGGRYVGDTGSAGEQYNFLNRSDGYTIGFAEPGFTAGGYEKGKQKQIHIEKINKIAADKDQISNVMVIMCAKSPIINKTVIVGWYDNATVYRNVSYQTLENGEKIWQTIKCKNEDAHLISEEDRTFNIPRAATDGIGLGQSNYWYADTKEAQDFKNKVIEYIDKIR